MSLERLWTYTWRTFLMAALFYAVAYTTYLRWTNPAITETQIFQELIHWKTQHETNEKPPAYPRDTNHTGE